MILCFLIGLKFFFLARFTSPLERSPEDDLMGVYRGIYFGLVTPPMLQRSFAGIHFRIGDASRSKGLVRMAREKR